MEDIFFILLFIILLLCLCNINIVEGFSDRELYENLMNDFNIIFPDRNRNAGGPQFYHHIVSMDPTIEEFKKMNTFYCAVSGSPIDPNRDKTYDNIITTLIVLDKTAFSHIRTYVLYEDNLVFPVSQAP